MVRVRGSCLYSGEASYQWHVLPSECLRIVAIWLFSLRVPIAMCVIVKCRYCACKLDCCQFEWCSANLVLSHSYQYTHIQTLQAFAVVAMADRLRK